MITGAVEGYLASRAPHTIKNRVFGRRRDTYAIFVDESMSVMRHVESADNVAAIVLNFTEKSICSLVVTRVRRLPQRVEIRLFVRTASRPRELNDAIGIDNERRAARDIAMVLEFLR